MKFLIILLILIPIVLFGKPGDEYDDNYKYLNLGEDTVIAIENFKKDTVYTLDGNVMAIDFEGGRIAIGEIFFKVDMDNVVVIDAEGKETTFNLVPEKGVIRARFIKRKDKFVIMRIRILENPE